MGESFLYTWEDVDAPVLTASNGSMTALLQAVLVDGYGSKAGLGWTTYFSGTNKKVFKNEGTETLVQFDHSQEAWKVYYRGYESMSDIDNGVLPCPAFSFTDNYILLTEANAASANEVPWRILGDDKGIWILVNPYAAQAGGFTSKNTALFKTVYIGDYIPFDLTNIHHNFCTIQGNYPNTSAYDRLVFSGFKTTVNHYSATRGLDGSPGAVNLGMSSGSAYEPACFGRTPDICRPDSQVQLTSLPMLHTSQGILGRLPGVKNSLSAWGNGGVLLGSTYAEVIAVKPEMVFDSGDYKEHFWHTASHGTVNIAYIVFTEGRGFRNVI